MEVPASKGEDILSLRDMTASKSRRVIFFGVSRRENRDRPVSLALGESMSDSVPFLVKPDRERNAGEE